MNNLIETKVAASAGTGGLASIIVLALHLAFPRLHFDPALVAAIVTAATAVAGYLAPHTARPPANVVVSPAPPSPTGTTTGPLS